MTLQKHTIDVGIDLGTTNSAIAVMLNGEPVIVPDVTSRSPTIPSVVRIRQNGNLDIGESARRYLGALPDDVHGEFKRAMGDSSARFRFAAAGVSMTPQALSAEVLKVLRAAVQHAYGLAPRAAVITVPAAFELNQCASTQEAAVLAGLEQAPLLQEPVAASLAYGYAQEIASGEWLVYDLGGGTFDLALVGVRDGRVQVIDHEGDNFLGGKDFDWLLVEEVLLQRLARKYDVASFRRGNAARRPDMALLKSQAEGLKVALSGVPTASVTIESGRNSRLPDDRGVEIEEEIEVHRDEFERLLAGPIERTLEMCRSLLSRNPGVEPARVLLVGGPTLTPYVRHAIATGLGIPIETSANPMTVVAEGAAVFAAAQPLSVGKPASPGAGATDRGTVAVQLRHATVTEDSETAVGLSFDSPAAANVEVSAGDGSWRSGRIALRNGAAVLRVPLTRRGANGFLLELADGQGAILACAPASFEVHRGLTAGAPPLSRSIGVVIRDEGAGRKTVDWLLRKGTPLPASVTYEFRTTLALEPGDEIEVIAVYFVEGEASRPERNRLVGGVEITDRDVPQVVPAGAPVEVRLEVSASRLLTAQVFLPSTDQVFDVEVRMESEKATAASLTRALLDERHRLEGIAPHVNSEEMRRLKRQAETLARAIQTASGEDPGSEQQALMALKAFQDDLDAIDARVEVPRATEAAEKAVDEARQVISTLGSESQQRRIEALDQDVQAAVASGNLVAIERATGKVRRLQFEVLGAQPWFWRDWFQYLSTSVTDWRDPDEADRQVRQGANAIREGDVSTLRHATLALAGLAPEEEGSFSNVGLRRA